MSCESPFFRGVTRKRVSQLFFRVRVSAFRARRLGRHQSALEHAQQALILLQEELSQVIAPASAEQRGPPKADRIAVLAIAYHNVGVEQEFLKKHQISLQSYRKGVEVAERYLGPDHAITTTLRNSCVAARRTMLAKDPQARLAKTSQSRIKPKPKVTQPHKHMLSPRPPNDGEAEEKGM